MATDPVVAQAALSSAIGVELSSVPQVANITVNKDNVLQAAKIIQDLIDNEGNDILATLRALKVDAPGADLVSKRAAQQWNQRLADDPDSFKARVTQYLGTLNTLVSNLQTSAKQYGYTDEQIAAAFSQAGGAGA
jgi:formiminotetrahydrofolate cyclodeaminase